MKIQFSLIDLSAVPLKQLDAAIDGVHSSQDSREGLRISWLGHHSLFAATRVPRS